MRSHLLARRTRSLVKTLPNLHRAQLSSTHALRYPRKDPQATPRLSRRTLSSEIPAAEHLAEGASSSSSPPADPPIDSNGPDASPPEDGAGERPKRRTRASAASASATAGASKDASDVSLPDGLNVLWTPEGGSGGGAPQVDGTTLPPPEIFNEALHGLHIALHPQTQHRGTYGGGASGSGASPVEPTLALYCPIEGGDYILDETVRELARRTDADVVVLDAVQLAAGECGHFGKAAAALQLPNNPLHFLSSSSSEPAHPISPRENDEEEDESPSPFVMSPMTVHVMTAIPRRSARGLLEASRSSPALKLKAFFDELINVSSSADSEDASAAGVRRPRIIYIKDYPTLAASSSVWYPALLASVRQRRQGAMTRSNSPVLNPTAIVFGISPSFLVPEKPSHAPAPSMSMLATSAQQSAGTTTSNTLKSQNEFGEDSNSEKAREKRIQRRLKRWARGDSDDIPRLHSAADDGIDPTDGAKGRPNVVVLGQEGLSGLPPLLGSAFSRALAGRSHGASSGDGRPGFFRTALVFPTVRSLPAERASRMARRREINELVMRMGVAQVGGVLGPLTPADVPDAADEGAAAESHAAAETETHAHEELDRARAQMWTHWGRTVEVWPHVQRIADRAVGGVIAASRAFLPSSGARTLEPTHVPWAAVFDAWAADRSTQDLWKTLFATPPSGKVPREPQEDGRAAAEDEADVDEIIEKLRRNPDLDEHEQRLLGCIVDTASITTTFGQVHLPDHTIDSVRTMVSLPLLHPGAFQQGILKEHSMTGCLLFGPPGTGKTLVVRALAKEAGCRMLVVSPSDIMDMYVGEGEKLVRAVFSLARRLSPCVVFIDELDALFGARLSRESGNSLAHRGVITEFMQEMDGLKSSKESNVIVIGATNRPFDLDDAVLRRLPRRLLVDLPGEKEREEILKILLRDEALAEDVDLKQLAKRTESFSGSDLKHLCVSAALDAVKERVTVPWRQFIAIHPSTPEASSNPTERAPAELRKSDEPQLPGAHSSVVEVIDMASQEQREQQQPPSAVQENADDPAPAQESDEQDRAAADAGADDTPHVRSLARRNFDQALKEITPSASEALGSLSELRKWNDEFGEGRRTKKRQVWGKGRFGFTVPATTPEAMPTPVELEPQPGATTPPPGL